MISLINSKDSSFGRSIGSGRSFLDNIFPLPLQTDKKQCRDAYLKQVLAPYEIIQEEEEKESSINLRPTLIKFSEMSQNSVPYPMPPILEPKKSSDDKSRRTHPSFLSSDSRILAVDLNEIMLMRYRYQLSDIGHQSVCYQIENLKSQLMVIRNVCCGQSDFTYKIFNWSIIDHLATFETKRNTVYLDILERVKTDRELDKMKLKVDISEIIRLLDAIQDDVKSKKDPCENSLRLLKHTQHDIEKYLTAPFEKLQIEHDNLAMELLQCKPSPLVTSRLTERRQYVKLKRLDTDYVQPVEVRYSVKLAHDFVEQASFGDNLAQKAITDELAKLELLTHQDLYVWQLCQMSYFQTIGDYKERIDQLQITYDEDMERTENELQDLRNNVQKCKDDLLFFQDQVEFFRSEVERVLDIIAEEELQQKAKKTVSKKPATEKQQGRRKSTKRKK